MSQHVVCFSSFTYSYLDRAKVLFRSLRRFHPNWHLVALITDLPPSEVTVELPAELFDETVFSKDLGIVDFERWLFCHDIVEICTAVKGPFLEKLCGSGADVVIYLDPDTCLFNDLQPVLEALRNADIILTPHQLAPDHERRSIIDNEITSLKTGIYNLGFIAINTSGDGLAFARWWATRLLEFCHDDIPNGLFVDQRWCDHVPSFFSSHFILRDPGFNVASWNLSNRLVSIDRNGAVCVNGFLLRFWHFTKLGPTGDVMTRRYARENYEVHELWNWYRRAVADERIGVPLDRYWAYGVFQDGTPIRNEFRRLYRSRADLRNVFAHPFSSGEGTFQGWLAQEGLLA